MTAFYGKPRWETLYIETDTGYGMQSALGVIYSDMAISLCKDGGDFESKSLLESEWRDHGDGVYSFLWNESDLNTLGEIYYTFSVPSLDYTLYGKFDVDPMPFYLDATAPTCAVSGNIVDIGGSPINRNEVFFRPRSVPGVAGQSIMASGHISTVTDVFGNFSVVLLRGAIVLVEISNAGIRHQIVVPDLPSASILDLLPPIPSPVP